MSELNRAYEFLQHYRDIADTDPHWYQVMANVLRGFGAESEEFWQLIMEGISDYPYYHDIYFAAALYYSPEWYGSQCNEYLRVVFRRFPGHHCSHESVQM